MSGLVGVIGFGATSLAEYGLVVAPGLVPGAIWLEWISAWTWAPYLIPMAWLLPLVFPTGRLPSPRWRPVAAIAVACVVLTAAQAALTPFTDAELPASVQNPLLVTGSGTIVLSVILIVVLACGVVTPARDRLVGGDIATAAARPSSGNSSSGSSPPLRCSSRRSSSACFSAAPTRASSTWSRRSLGGSCSSA